MKDSDIGRCNKYQKGKIQKRIRIVFYIFLCCLFSVHAQKSDSLKQLLYNEKNDSVRVRLLNSLCQESIFLGENAQALIHGRKALILADHIGSKIGSAKSHNLIGTILVYQGDLAGSLREHFKSLEILESINAKNEIANGYISLGSSYFYHTNYVEANKYYLDALKMFKALNDSDGVATAYIGLGAVNEETGNYDGALENFKFALKIKEKKGTDKNRIAITYMNIGNVYSAKGQYDDALKNLLKSLEVREKNGQLGGKSGVLISIGNLFLKQMKIKESEFYLKEGIRFGQISGTKVWSNSGYYSLVKIDSLKGDFRSAFEHYKIATQLKDSIRNEEAIKKSTQIAMQNDFDKKELVVKADQEKKDSLAKIQIEEKEKERNYFIVGFILIALFAVFVLRSYRQNKRSNAIIISQKRKVDEKQKEILDSIRYAQRIQRAQLPNERFLEKTLQKLRR